MAWHYGTYACGHEGRTDIIGPTRDREWKAARHFEKLCEDCWEKKLVADREKANAEAAELAKEMELPGLDGTEKQIMWGNTIRCKFIEDATKYGTERKAKPIYFEALDRILKSKTKASWWIDNRERKCYLLVEAAVSEIQDELHGIGSKTENAIKAEAAVFPLDCKFSLPAEITVRDNQIVVAFEKNDAFREVVKGLGYKWGTGNGGWCWYKDIRETTGTAAERAAELGNKLLNAGIPISILDPEIRQNAINAHYQPECANWIYLCNSGACEGWLAIHWGHKDEALYKRARSLPGARWEQSYSAVVVKAGYWKEVEEFSALYGFKMTKAAQKAVAAHKEGAALSLKAAPATPKDHHPHDGLKQILESSTEVLNDLIEK